MSGKKSQVLVVDSKYSELNQHMSDILDFSGLDVKGKTILIKPNFLFYTEPEQGLNTHPAVIEAVIKECERRGAKKIYLGDNAGQVMYGNSRAAFDESVGLGDRFGKYYVNLGLDLEPYYLDCIKDTLYLPKLLKQVDLVFNLPKMKTHGLACISGAVKNTFGYVAGAQKSKMHFYAKTYVPFAHILVAIHMLRKPDLSIMDAILGMEGRGPFSRKLRYIGQVLVSKDPVALDSVMCHMIGFKPSDIPMLQAAQEQGLGTYEDNCIEVIGKPRIMPDFLLPPNAETPWDINKEAGVLTESLIRDAHRTIAQINPELCTRCGDCVRQCPAGVLEMKDSIPFMNGKKCVSCHACQEVCQVKALMLESTTEKKD